MVIYDKCLGLRESHDPHHQRRLLRETGIWTNQQACLLPCASQDSSTILNSKKSWHPGLLRNRAKVLEREKEELEERRRIEERRKDIEEEREIEELRKLQNPDVPRSRLEWMYQAPPSRRSDKETSLIAKGEQGKPIAQETGPKAEMERETEREERLVGKHKITGRQLSQPRVINDFESDRKLAKDPMAAILSRRKPAYRKKSIGSIGSIGSGSSSRGPRGSKDGPIHPKESNESRFPRRK